MKRWFIPLVCLVLVFSIVAPFPAMAAYSFIDLSLYKTGTSTSGVVSYIEYSYADTGYSAVFGGGINSSGFTGNSYECTTSSAGAFRIDHGYTKNKNINASIGANSVYHKITGCNNVDYFTSATVYCSYLLYSSVAISGRYSFFCIFYDDEFNRISSDSYSDVACSLPAGEYTEFHISNELTIPAGAVYFCPYVLFYFPSVPTGTYIYFSETCPAGDFHDNLSYGFRYVVRTERNIEQPSFIRNLPSGPVYYETGVDPDLFVVEASVSDGGSISYQWYENTKALSYGATLISGENGRSFYPPTSEEGEMYYYCIATSTNSGLSKSRISNIVHVIVYTPPVTPQISSNLASGLLEYIVDSPANSLNFNAIITDDGTLTYQWYSNSVNSNSGGTAISGETSSQFTPPTDVVGLTYYYCVATNTKYEFTASVSSNVAAIRVVPPPEPADAPVITSDLSTEEVIYEKGDSASALGIGAESPDGGVLTYQWYEVIDGSFVEIPGEIYASFTPNTATIGTRQFACIVTNTLNETFASVTSQTATVTVQKDHTDTLLGNIIDAITGMWESLTELPYQITEGLSSFFDDLSAKLGSVFEAIAGLPQAILDGIKGLFVPDAEAIAAYQDQWSELLKERFGAIYESVDVIGTFVSSLNASSQQDQIKIPAVTVNLAGVPWTFGGWSVSVVPEGFGFLATSSKLIVNIIATFAFINGLRNKFEGILGGHGA